MHRGDNGGRERSRFFYSKDMRDGPEREMSERMRHAGGEERLTFDPGRPISPWRRTNEGRGDVALIRAERNTRTHAPL